MATVQASTNYDQSYSIFTNMIHNLTLWSKETNCQYELYAWYRYTYTHACLPVLSAWLNMSVSELSVCLSVCPEVKHVCLWYLSNLSGIFVGPFTFMFVCLSVYNMSRQWTVVLEVECSWTLILKVIER